MKAWEIWEFIGDRIAREEPVGLLVVVESQGSSPGRQGFKMAIAQDGAMVGSIGGGIMEHKLVEWVRDRLQKQQSFCEIKRQIHSKDAAIDQSGMICSGEQTIALCSISRLAIASVTSILDQLKSGGRPRISLTANGLACIPQVIGEKMLDFTKPNTANWCFEETLGLRDVAHVIGAGHVGLEMCRMLNALDFWVINYDDRPGLNTMEANAFAHQKIVTRYPDLHRHVRPGPDSFVIVMTFGYRGDDEAVRALLGQHYAYFGMMGSETKVAKLLGDLRRDGFSEEYIAQLHTPAGLIHHCKTPAEIAVSIAAEMIAVRNARQ